MRTNALTPWYTPSTKPYASSPMPISAVRYSGRIALIISEETSVSRLTTPRSTTVVATRRRIRPAGEACSLAGASRTEMYIDSAQRVCQRGDHALLLVDGDLREERQRQDLGRGLLRVRESAVDEAREGRRAVHRHRVMDAGADALRVERGDDLVAPVGRDAHHVEVPDVHVAGRRHRAHHVDLGQQLVV